MTGSTLFLNADTGLPAGSPSVPVCLCAGGPPFLLSLFPACWPPSNADKPDFLRSPGGQPHAGSGARPRSPPLPRPAAPSPLGPLDPQLLHLPD